MISHVATNGKVVIEQMFEPYDGVRDFRGAYEMMTVIARCTTTRVPERAESKIRCELVVDDLPAGVLSFDQKGPVRDG